MSRLLAAPLFLGVALLAWLDGADPWLAVVVTAGAGVLCWWFGREDIDEG